MKDCRGVGSEGSRMQNGDLADTNCLSGCSIRAVLRDKGKRITIERLCGGCGGKTRILLWEGLPVCRWELTLSRKNTLTAKTPRSSSSPGSAFGTERPDGPLWGVSVAPRAPFCSPSPLALLAPWRFKNFGLGLGPGYGGPKGRAGRRRRSVRSRGGGEAADFMIRRKSFFTPAA